MNYLNHQKVKILRYIKWRHDAVMPWRRGVMVINTAQLHSTKPEFRFCASSKPTRGVS